MCVFIRFLRLRFSASFFYTSYAAAFQCFIFYTSYVLFLFFMFVISTVFSLTHPLVLCNTFEYNFYSIFYNILLFQSVILVNYICCKIYNICVVFTVYFSLYDPLLHFLHINLCPAKPYHMKNLTTQPCHTKSLTTQNIVEQKPYRAKTMPYKKSHHPKPCCMKNFTTQSIVVPSFTTQSINTPKYYNKKISPHYAFPTFHKELALHTKKCGPFWPL